MDREYHVVVYGATGFTGKLVAEYMARRAPAYMQWAIAGRSSAKLEAVRNSLSSLAKPLNCPREIFVADVFDLESLRSFTCRTKVVLSTVGPYAKYGEPLLRACVETKTDYVDITGETPWIRNMIDRYHQRAVDDGTIIVPSCGYDSIPSDLGVFMVVDYIRTKWGKRTANVRGSLLRFKGGVSGGTVSSALTAATSLRNAVTDPYIISPVRGLQTSSLLALRYDADFAKWQGAWVMALPNSRMVQRSWGLHASTPNSYGDRFTYTESRSYSNVVAAVLASLSVLIGQLLFMLPPIQWVAGMLAPAPGTGPSRQAIEEGFFEFQVVGEAEPESSEHPKKVRAKIVGHKDPGYGETAMMVAESAICIALERDRLPGKGGILSPATAFGSVLVEKLRAGGMELEVGEIVPKSSSMSD